MDSTAQENITHSQVISLTHYWPSSFTPTPAIFLHSLASSSCFQLVLCLLQLTRNCFSFTWPAELVNTHARLQLLPIFELSSSLPDLVFLGWKSGANLASSSFLLTVKNPWRIGLDGCTCWPRETIARERDMICFGSVFGSVLWLPGDQIWAGRRH